MGFDVRFEFARVLRHPCAAHQLSMLLKHPHIIGVDLVGAVASWIALWLFGHCGSRSSRVPVGSRCVSWDRTSLRWLSTRAWIRVLDEGETIPLGSVVHGLFSSWWYRHERSSRRVLRVSWVTVVTGAPSSGCSGTWRTSKNGRGRRLVGEGETGDSETTTGSRGFVGTCVRCTGGTCSGLPPGSDRSPGRICRYAYGGRGASGMGSWFHSCPDGSVCSPGPVKKAVTARCWRASDRQPHRSHVAKGSANSSSVRGPCAPDPRALASRNSRPHARALWKVDR